MIVVLGLRLGLVLGLWLGFVLCVRDFFNFFWRTFYGMDKFTGILLLLIVQKLFFQISRENIWPAWFRQWQRLLADGFKSLKRPRSGIFGWKFHRFDCDLPLHEYFIIIAIFPNILHFRHLSLLHKILQFTSSSLSIFLPFSLPLPDSLTHLYHQFQFLFDPLARHKKLFYSDDRSQFKLISGYGKGTFCKFLIRHSNDIGILRKDLHVEFRTILDESIMKDFQIEPDLFCFDIFLFQPFTWVVDALQQ